MVNSLFLQSVASDRQPKDRLAVFLRNGLIGIWHLAIAAGNLYIDISVLDLGVLLQVIDRQFHAIQRIAVLVRGLAIGQITAASRCKVNIGTGTGDGQRTVSAVIILH